MHGKLQEQVVFKSRWTEGDTEAVTSRGAASLGGKLRLEPQLSRCGGWRFNCSTVLPLGHLCICDIEEDAFISIVAVSEASWQSAGSALLTRSSPRSPWWRYGTGGYVLPCRGSCIFPAEKMSNFNVFFPHMLVLLPRSVPDLPRALSPTVTPSLHSQATVAELSQ